ncbi:MAG: polysaccharide pyruvyl transferase family protein [Erysipelotrichaceae bacterium]|nr:polysaccharide pyruvyl transferase family protein [Erysipelotrichaceae bacterium]
MQKKVGIVSCYFKNNYGSLLQAYATQKILDDNNIPNETINIDNLEDFKKGKRKYYLGQITNFGFIKTKEGMIKLKLQKIFNHELGENIAIRDKKFEEYKQVFNLTTAYPTYEYLYDNAKAKYSDVIVGSDQLWLPVNVVADYYTLNWVPDDVNKISYSTSFGVSKIPDKYKDSYKNFLSRINHLSTREESGIKLIKSVSNIDAKLVCDPTLLLTKDDWAEHAVKDRIIKDKYIFCYFLGKNIEHRKFVERLKEKTGYKIVSINHSDEYVKYSDTFADIVPYDIGPKEWINLISNAEYICCDSFHGTVFSIIFNKTFFAFRRFSQKNENNTNSRLDSLLNMAGISTDRILSGTENVDDMINNKINYTSVNKNIDEFRKNSKDWLLNSITYKPVDNIDKYIKIEDKEMCTGCTACMNKCPTKSISMKMDEEGFLYPIVNDETCINCGLCIKTCPIINENKIKLSEQHAFVFQHKDNKIRKESTSGGAFSAIAEEILSKNGVVYGVGFDENFKVIHQRVTDVEKLYKFRNSKYVQSNPNVTFTQVLSDLKDGRLVVYSGTSCQIAGLKKFLNKDYDNLILVDVVCRAVPSPLMWEKYLEMRKKKYKSPQRIYFREKVYGYKYSNLTIYTEDNSYKSGIDSDPYLRAFFSNICDRPSCYNCKFKSLNRQSDITIWDCFNVEKFNKNLDDDIGTTRVLCNTSKGLEMINKLSEIHTCKEIEMDKALEDFNAIFSNVRYNKKRKEFIEDMNKLEPEKLFNKYFPDTYKIKTERFLRKMLLKTGQYKKVITFGKKIRKRV